MTYLKNKTIITITFLSFFSVGAGAVAPQLSPAFDSGMEQCTREACSEDLGFAVQCLIHGESLHKDCIEGAIQSMKEAKGRQNNKEFTKTYHRLPKGVRQEIYEVLTLAREVANGQSHLTVYLQKSIEDMKDPQGDVQKALRTVEKQKDQDMKELSGRLGSLVR